MTNRSTPDHQGPPRPPGAAARRVRRGLVLAAFASAAALPAQEPEDPAKTPAANGAAGHVRKAVPGTLVRSSERMLDKEFVVRERLDVFFGELREGSVEKAFQELLEGSKIAATKRNLDALVESTLAVREYGGLESPELVRAKRVGSRTVRLSYLSYSADFPLLWNFYCYRSGEAWQILDIKVSNDLGLVFEESPLPETPGESVEAPGG